MNKIGLAIMTYNRIDYLKQCLASLKENNYGGADYVVVVDDCSTDGTVEFLETLPDNIHIITKDENRGIAHSKNNGLEALMMAECEHLFLMEDDILMKYPKTCNSYVTYAKMFNLHHLNFALHGPMNIGKGASTIEGIRVYPDCVGAFSYYTKECIDKIGYLDEKFINAWEHVEHTYRICKAGMTTPFWTFADNILNYKLLKEIPNSIDNSSIRPREDWKENIEKGKEYFIKKHGCWLPPRQ